MKPSILSSQYNLSLGFTPAVCSMLLYEWVDANLAVYLGTALGICIILIEKWRGKAPVSWLLLYSTTGILLLLSAFSLLFGECSPTSLLPLTVEIIVMIPPVLFILNRNRWMKRSSVFPSKRQQKRYQLGLEASIASAKLIVILGAIHFLIISLSVMLSHPLHATTSWILFELSPPLLFITSMILNQIEISYFNRLEKKATYLPIVNEQGDVIGKTSIWNLKENSQYLHPVIRIAITMHGMLYLKPRPTNNLLEPGKTDLPIEGYLTFGESLEQGIERMLNHLLPNIPKQNIRFNLKYHFELPHTNRLVYLFSLDLPNELPLKSIHAKDGKLWTLKQVEHNLKQHFFSNCFEYEFEHLKDFICTGEKYKES